MFHFGIASYAKLTTKASDIDSSRSRTELARKRLNLSSQELDRVLSEAMKRTSSRAYPKIMVCPLDQRQTQTSSERKAVALSPRLCHRWLVPDHRWHEMLHLGSLRAHKASDYSINSHLLPLACKRLKFS